MIYPLGKERFPGKSMFLGEGLVGNGQFHLDYSFLFQTPRGSGDLGLDFLESMYL